MTSEQTITVHLLDAVHAHREGDALGCDAEGTKRVAPDLGRGLPGEVNCPRCESWYYSQGLVLTEQGRRGVALDS